MSSRTQGLQKTPGLHNSGVFYCLQLYNLKHHKAFNVKASLKLISIPVSTYFLHASSS